jgi:predicted Zn finger-like uncharacterized protein
MRIVCPACDATYDVPDALLAGGTRKVRCARCGTEWLPSPAAPRGEIEFEPEPTFDSVPDPSPEPPAGWAPPNADPRGRHEPRLRPLRSRPEPRAAEPQSLEEPPPRAGAAAIVAWVLSLLLLAAAAGAAVTWRTQVMAAWPPSERLYSAVGLR